MSKDISVKFIDFKYIEKELESIGFDSSYLHHAIDKNTIKTIKVMNLRPQEATILKQSALSLGFDAAVNRGVLDCSVDFSDAILSGSLVQFEKLCRTLEKQPFKMKLVSKEIKNILYNSKDIIKFDSLVMDWTRPYIVGILNITPDSFSDGGMCFDEASALLHFNKLLEDGADIIDIGAESTRPNHEKISVEEEITRLKPILKALRKENSMAVISVDTRNVETAKMAIDEGANIINDVGFDSFNQDMIDFVNQNNVPYVLTHNLKVEQNVVEKVFLDLKNKLVDIKAPVIADVGIGFGKSVEANFELVDRISEFQSLNVPIMVGHSRKSFLSKTFNYCVEDLDRATVALSVKMAMNGVNLIRVHDVKNHKLALDVILKNI